MKNTITLLAVYIITAHFATAQNPAFYKQHPTKSNISWYNQINIDPVVIKSGTVTSENVKPSWYGAFQFLNCPAVFNSVTEAYGFLVNNTAFLDTSDFSFYNRKNAAEQQLYLQKDFLQKSISLTTQQIKDDGDAYNIAGCREQVVFKELYLKINNQEIVILYSSPMFLLDLDSNSSINKKTIVDYFLSGCNPAVRDNYGIEMTVLIKENSVWKFPYNEIFMPYLEQQVGNFAFLDLNGKPVIHIESRVNTAKTRVYLQK
jgi:hypothetical protein